MKTTIKIQIAKTIVELELEDARMLRDKLNDLLGDPRPLCNPYQPPILITPMLPAPPPEWGYPVITCQHEPTLP